jgi:hypothetical protein
MATLNPFSNANVLDHIISPKITGPSGGAYQVGVDLVDIDTVYSRQIGSTGKVVQDLYVNKLYWNQFVPTLPGLGGQTGSLLGGTGISLSTNGNVITISTSVISGVTGGTGISVSSTGLTYNISSALDFVAGPGMIIGQTGNTYTFSSYTPLTTPGATGQLTYFSGGGITSSNSMSFNGTQVTLPATIVDLQTVRGILKTISSGQNILLMPGIFNSRNSATSLRVTPVDGGLSTLAVNVSNKRVGINIDSPTTTLDVNGQTQITYDSSNGADSITTVVASGTSGSYTAATGRYTFEAWGGGGAGNGGTGGAGGYSTGTVDVLAGVFSWRPAFGGANGGGNALVLQFDGFNPALIVPGGGAGTTGGIGAAAGEVRGMSLLEAGLSPGSGLTATASYTDTRSWRYRFPTNTTALTGVTFTAGTIGALTGASQTGTSVSFSPGASQISSQAGATYTAAAGTFITINSNNILYTSSAFSTPDTSIVYPSIPINIVDGGTGITGATGTALATYDNWPGVTLPAITGNPAIMTNGGLFSFGTPNVRWLSGQLGFTATSPYTFFFDGPIVDSGPIGNNLISLSAPGNIITNQPLPLITNSVIGVSSATVPINSSIDVLSRYFINYGQPATGNTGSTGAGGGATGGGSAALVTGILGGMTANTPDNQAAGGGAGSRLFTNTPGLFYIGTPTFNDAVGIYPYASQNNQNLVYGIGGTGNSASGGSPYFVLQQVTAPAVPQQALIVNGNERVTGVLTANTSISVGNASTLVQIIPDGANGIRIAGVNGYSAGPSGNVAISGTLTTLGPSTLRGDTVIGQVGFSNSSLTVGNAPVGGIPGPGDINATGFVRGIGAGFVGSVSGGSGNFGPLNASIGTFTGDVTSSGNGNFLGLVNAAGATFTGPLRADSGTFTLDIIARNGTFSGDIIARNGTFSGALFATGNVTGADVIATSDVRTKNSIETVESALDKVMKMRGVFFERNIEPGERRVGVIAQEIEKVLPEVVYTDSDGMKSVSYGSIIGVLIEAIKELNTK